MATDITRWCWECMFCQRAKVHHIHVWPLPIPVLGCWFSHIHADLMGPLLPSSGNTYLFIITNRSSR